MISSIRIWEASLFLRSHVAHLVSSKMCVTVMLEVPGESTKDVQEQLKKSTLLVDSLVRTKLREAATSRHGGRMVFKGWTFR